MQKEVSNNCDKTRNAEEVSHNCHKTRSAEKVFTIVKLTRDHKDGRCGPFGNTPLLHELTWLWECQAYCNSCHQSCSHQQNSNRCVMQGGKERKKGGTKSFKPKNSFNRIRKHTKTMQQQPGQATPTYGKKICSCKIENRVACRLQLFQSSSSSLINIFIIIIITTCCCCLGTCIVGSPLLQQQKNRS